MNFILLGINHKSASLMIREKYSFSPGKLSEILLELSQKPVFKGVIILSTCNRLEIYAITDSVEKVREYLFFLLRIDRGEQNYFYFLQDREAIFQLLLVASGLDSQIIGETQILEQVRMAWRKAKELETTHRMLDMIFAKAIEVSIKVRSQTEVSHGKVSLGSIVLELLKTKFSSLEDKRILIIGVGKISELVVKYLSKEKVKVLFITNRTYEKAKELANFIQGEAVRFEQLKKRLKETDIVISATSSPHLILKKEEVLEAISHKQLAISFQPLLIIDLAIPRDVDPELKKINGVSLFDLEDLNFLIEKNLEKRRKALPQAKEIIEEELEKLWKELTELEPGEVLLP
ncbi:MAG: glutamyl-tRNA reductase [Candidatus Omnitrophica bacterium]|nr:glutamyl-tRNA reductase [Candidatus Omnitrophota bacterium]